MRNADLQQAWTYHNQTRHSERSIRTDPHYLDWSIRPRPTKSYPSLEPIPLPSQGEQTGIAALSAISHPVLAALNTNATATPTLNDLARILYFSAGITKVKRYANGEIQFRAAACTGALYAIELYIACGDLPGLEAGLYHFGPDDFSLRCLRKGDFRPQLVRATAAETQITQAPATIICTGTYWRNSWKYRSRTYRHFGWDNGTLLANLLAMTNGLGLPAKVVCGFLDSDVNRLLGMDTAREVAFSMVPLGHTDDTVTDAASGIPALDLPDTSLQQGEIDYPLLRMIHEASSLDSVEEVDNWRVPAPESEASTPMGPLISLQPLDDNQMPRDVIEQVILRRGSSRRFARVPISFASFSTILDRATRGIPADFLNPPGTQLNDLYIIVNAVEGLAPGSYLFRRDTLALECLREGAFRGEARHLGLQQDLPGDASAAIFFLADLKAILARFGNRGYRAVQLEAGIIGGKLYLGAYALRLGATGLTFFDDDVTAFFSPHAEGRSAIFLAAIGKGIKQG